VDRAIGLLLDNLRIKDFDTIICVTGDHTTPVKYGDHSHEPVPIVIGSVKGTPINKSFKFDEITCSRGRLGRFSGDQIIPLLLKFKN
jgi:2,3-bisphosphoglycerate-independent phosphoglycerate mutase